MFPAEKGKKGLSGRKTSLWSLHFSVIPWFHALRLMNERLELGKNMVFPALYPAKWEFQAFRGHRSDVKLDQIQNP